MQVVALGLLRTAASLECSEFFSGSRFGFVGEGIGFVLRSLRMESPNRIEILEFAAGSAGQGGTRAGGEAARDGARKESDGPRV